MSSITGTNPTGQFPFALSEMFTSSRAFSGLYPKDFKLHSAIRNSKAPGDPKGRDPFSVAIYGDGKEWLQWNRNAPNDDFKKPYIFSMARMEKRTGQADLWVFGGVFVVQSGPFFVPAGSPVIEGAHAVYDDDRYEYDIYLSVIARHLIGKMVIEFNKPAPQPRYKLGEQIDKMQVVRIDS